MRAHFTSAKQALDDRDDPRQPSVSLLETDIVYACRQIPAPPTRPSPVVSTEVSKSSAADAQSPPFLKASGVMEGTCVSGRNLILRLVSADHLRDARRTCFSASMSPYVDITIDGVQVYRTFHHPRGHTEPRWNEVVILPIPTEAHQIDFTVRSVNGKSGRFVSSCTRALSSICYDGFSGGLELSHAGKKAGVLEVQMAWQMVLTPEPAASLFKLK